MQIAFIAVSCFLCFLIAIEAYICSERASRLFDMYWSMRSYQNEALREAHERIDELEARIHSLEEGNEQSL